MNNNLITNTLEITNVEVWGTNNQEAPNIVRLGFRAVETCGGVPDYKAC